MIKKIALICTNCPKYFCNFLYEMDNAALKFTLLLSEKFVVVALI